jgi:hypothetical protein
VQGELVRLGHLTAASTVWQIIYNTDASPRARGTGPTWKQFLMPVHKTVRHGFCQIRRMVTQNR